MNVAPMNTLAILVAALAAWLFGALWYRLFGTQRLATLGETAASLSAKRGPALSMILSLAAEIIMAFMLAGLIAHLGPGQTTIRNGIISGIFAWIGFVLTTMIVNNALAGFNRKRLAIDGGHWLLVLVIMGAVIGAFG